MHCQAVKGFLPRRVANMVIHICGKDENIMEIKMFNVITPVFFFV